MKFEYYVPRCSPNGRKMEMFNIFDNINIQQWTERAVKKYLKAPSKYYYISYMNDFLGKDSYTYGFDGLVKEINRILRHELWGRCQYEIRMCGIVESDSDKFEKWDCYQLCEPNIEMITHEVIRQYKEQLKKEKENEKISNN